MKVTSHFQTDPGQIRELNEDSALIVHPDQESLARSRGELLVVADGMGGHDSGEVASSQAVETIAEAYYRHSGAPPDALRLAIEEANAVIYERAQAEGRRGMGTTVVAAARVGELLHVAHVGDSRLYLIRRGEIRQLTNDHSLVAEQIAAGLLTPEEAARHPHRNVISRAVGTSPTVQVEIASASPIKLQEGDVVVLCSDGLTEHVRPEQIRQLLLGRPPREAAQALIDAANAAGGSDNISVIVLRVGEPEGAIAPTEPMEAVGGDREAPPSPMAGAGPRRAEAPRAPRPLVQEKRQAGSPFLKILLLMVPILLIGALYLFGPGYLDGMLPSRTPTTTSAPAFGTGPATTGTAQPGTSSGEVAATATVTLEPIGTARAEMTATSRPARTPTAESNSSPNSSPSATPLDGELTVTLLSPPSGALVSGASITFTAQISGLAPDDKVQLRMGATPENLETVGAPSRQIESDRWAITVNEPPGEYGEWYWTVVVVTEGISQGGEVVTYRADPPRRLEWQAPPD